MNDKNSTQIEECDEDVCVWQYDTADVTPQSITLRVKKLRDDIQPLKKAYENPACVDISISHLIKVDNGVAYFGTGMSMEIPKGYYIELHGRSSLPKHGWSIANNVGIIDEDYRGEIIVALQPLSTTACHLMLQLSRIERSTNQGNTLTEGYHIVPPSLDDVVNHMVTNMKLPVSLTQFKLCKKEDFSILYVDSLSVSERGNGAFGSSNK